MGNLNRGATVSEALRAQLHPEKNDPEILATGILKNSGMYWWQCPSDERHVWQAVLYSRVAGNGCPVCSNQLVLAGVNDIATTHPEIARYLSASLNSPDFATKVSFGSKKVAWWQCPSESRHVFDMPVAARMKTECPICTGKRLVVGVNDLASSSPELLREWHPTKNLPLMPDEVLAGTGKKIWWLCESNPQHEWVASGDSRAKQKRGCPICAGQKLNVGENDLATKFPEVAKLWDFERNAPLRPNEIFPQAGHKLWWKCDSGKGHSFQATSSAMVISRNCRVCGNRILQPGVNDLATTHPDLAKEWHPTKNLGVSPEFVSAFSEKKYWWLCSKDKRHEWEARVRPRATKGIGCPLCGFDLIVPGVNDLMTLYPDIAAQWCKARNKGIDPASISPGSKVPYWWRCTENSSHLWETNVRNRVRGSGCLICTRQIVHPGETDMATTHPELAREWHPTKNGNLTPNDVFTSSSKLVWWLCSIDARHEWHTTGANRAAGKGCPICSGKQIVPGLNDLGTTNPEMLKIWDYERNAGVDPRTISAGTHSKYWWKCSVDPTHIWRTSASGLKIGGGCPSCVNPGFDQTRKSTFYFIENDILRARKIGITNDGRRLNRVEEFEKQGWTRVLILRDRPGWEVLELETRMLRWIRSDVGLPIFLSPGDMKSTGGASETFSIEGISNRDVRARIEETLVEIDSLQGRNSSPATATKSSKPQATFMEQPATK